MPTIEEFMKQYGGGAQKQPEQQPVQQTEPTPEQQPRRTIADFMNQYGGETYKQNPYKPTSAIVAQQKEQPIRIGQLQFPPIPKAESQQAPQQLKQPTRTRQDYLKELHDLEEQAGYITDAEQGLQNAARRREITNALEEMDRREGNAPRYYDEATRAKGVLDSWANRTAGSYLGAFATLGQIEEQDDGRSPLADSPHAKQTASQYKTNKEMLEHADKLLGKSEEISAKVQNGASFADRLLADAATGALDLGADAVVNSVLPGSGLAMMGVRSFGQGAYDQRKQGGSVGKQILSGAKTATIEILTEKIGGPFEKVYGKSLTGKAVNGFIDRISRNPIVRNGLALASGFLSEGSEEVLSDILNPVADRLLKLDDGTGKIFKDGWFSDTLYDGLIGGLLGMAGEGVNIGAGREATQQQREAAKANAQREAVAAVDRAIAEREQAQGNAPAAEGSQEAAESPLPQGDIPAPAEGAETLTGQAPVLNSRQGETGIVNSYLRDNLERLQSEKPTAAVSTSDLYSMPGGSFIEKARALFQRIIGNVSRPGFGTVEINNRSMKDDFSHGLGEAKAAVVPAIPAVIQNGVQLDVQRQWRGKPYDGYVFAAPVMLDGKPVYVAAIVKQTSKNKFYLHEVVSSSGDVIKSGSSEKANQTSLAANGDAGTFNELPIAGDYSPTTNVAQPGENVNGQASDGERGFAVRENNTPQNRIATPPAEARNDSERGEFETLGERYGTIEQGENPARESAIPKQIDETRKTGETARTIYEAGATPESRLADIRSAVLDGKFAYISISNEELANEASKKVEADGWEKAVRDWTADVRSGKANEKLAAIGATLLNNAGNSTMSGEEYIELATDYNNLMRSLGRGLAAARILKTLTPEARLYAIQKTVDKYNAERKAQPKRKTEKAWESGDEKATEKKQKVKASDNVPVFLWAEKAGEAIAEKMALQGPAEPKRSRTIAKTAEENIKSVLRQYSKENAKLNRKALENIINNPAFYNDVFESLKKSLPEMTRMSNDATSAVYGEWIHNTLADVLAQEITGVKEVKLNPRLAEEFMNAKTDEERDAVISRMQQNIADQIPATVLEKWNALRYLNMLGNFKTQIRNVVGNTSGMLTAMAKNHAVKAIIEGLYGKVDSGYEKTSAVAYNPKLFAEAFRDWFSVKDEAMGERKYSDAGQQFERGIQDKRRIFKNNGTWGTAEGKNRLLRSLPVKTVRAVTDIGFAGLEGYRKATNWAMEAGDQIFSVMNYADAMAGWMAAHKVRHVSEMSQEMLDRARTYAIQQAQEATFRDTNAVSNWASKLGRGNKDTAFGKAVGLITEGVVPFRKTPANVMVRAWEYSPFGTLTAIGNKIAGKSDAQTFIDDLSKAFTGSGIAYVGYLLAAAGKLRLPDEDDKKEYFNKDRGLQDYSFITDDGKSITLDWLAPDCIPLFAGAEMYEILHGNGVSGDDAMKILGQMTEPMLEMSMLSGLNDALEFSTSNTNDMGALPSLVAYSLLSYMGQGLGNSLLRQGEQASENVRRTSYTDKESAIPNFAQRKLSQFLAGVPGVDYQQGDYIDAWGRKQEQGDLVQRVLQSFINPAYTQEDRSTPYDKELNRLYDAGMTGAIPQSPSRSTKVNDQQLSPEEYEMYAMVSGQKKLDLIGDFLDSKEYQHLDDEERADIIGNLYQYANYQAAKTIAQLRKEQHEDKTWDKVDTVERTGVDVFDYLIGKKNANADGEGSLTNSEVYNWLLGSDYSNRQKQAIWDANKGNNKHTWQEYYDSSPITALLNAGMSQAGANKMYSQMDTNGKNGASQEEIWNYYKAHPQQEAFIQALWDSQFKTSWADYRRKNG